MESTREDETREDGYVGGQGGGTRLHERVVRSDGGEDTVVTLYYVNFLFVST
jgi:hypothetical protein